MPCLTPLAPAARPRARDPLPPREVARRAALVAAHFERYPDTLATVAGTYRALWACLERSRVPREDIDAAVRYGVGVAAGKWDPARGAAFATVAMWWVRHSLCKLLREHLGPPAARGRVGHPDAVDGLWAAIPDPGAGRGPAADHAEHLRHHVAAALAVLDPRRRHVLVRRYGLDGMGRATLREVAAELGVTRERVRQLELQAADRVKRELQPRLAEVWG